MKQPIHFEELVDLLCSLSSKKDIEQFLVGILTPKELLEISQRVQIVKLLKQGISHRSIAESLQVGVATVTRGSREMQKGSFDFLWHDNLWRQTESTIT